LARTNSVNFTGANQFPIASAGTDIFKKEDVQVATKSLDLHNHSAGLGLPVDVTALAAGAIDGSKLTDGTVTSAKIQDGTIATADLANQSVTNAKLGTDTARLNLLTNGGFEIWQRGNGPFTANNAWATDCWSIQLGGTSTVSLSRITSTAGSSGFSAGVTYTHAAGGSFILRSQKFDSPAQLAGRVISASLMVKSNAAGTVKLRITDGVGNSDGAYNIGTTVEKLTVTRTVDANPTSIQVFVICDVGSCIIEMNDAMLVVGSVPADYAPLHPADDLARCLRYYETMGGTNNEYVLTGQAWSTTGTFYPLRFTVRKAITPTVTFTPSFGTTAAAGANTSLTNLTSAVITPAGSQIGGTVASGMVAGSATVLYSSGGSIVVEANP